MELNQTWQDETDTLDYNKYYDAFKQQEAHRRHIRITVYVTGALLIALLAVALAYMVGRGNREPVHDAPMSQPPVMVSMAPSAPPVPSVPDTPPVSPMTPHDADHEFLTTLQANGITFPQGPDRTIQVGHVVCMLLNTQTADQVAQEMEHDNPGLEPVGAQFFVASAQKLLCQKGA